MARGIKRLLLGAAIGVASLAFGAGVIRSAVGGEYWIHAHAWDHTLSLGWYHGIFVTGLSDAPDWGTSLDLDRGGESGFDGLLTEEEYPGSMLRWADRRVRWFEPLAAAGGFGAGFGRRERCVALVVGWLPCAAGVLGTLTLIRSGRNARRNRLDVCPHCGYDLSGTGERCPECGRARPMAGSAPAR